VSHTVLVCDDAIFMRTMITDILTQAGKVPGNIVLPVRCNRVENKRRVFDSFPGIEKQHLPPKQPGQPLIGERTAADWANKRKLTGPEGRPLSKE
jgi:hypothetical protein